MDASLLTHAAAIGWAVKLLADLIRTWWPDQSTRPGRTIGLVLMISYMLAVLWRVANGELPAPQMLAQSVFVALLAAAGAIGLTEAHKQARKPQPEPAAPAPDQFVAAIPNHSEAAIGAPTITDDFEAGSGGERWQ